MGMLSVIGNLLKETESGGSARSRSPEFLIGLGQAYVEAGLLDAAEEELSQIPSGHPLSSIAMVWLLEAKHKRGDSAGVLELAGKLVDGGDGSRWLASRMASAAFMAGRYEDARKYSEANLEWLPTSQEVVSALDTLSAGCLRPKLEVLLPVALRIGFSPHAVVDSLGPVLSGARSAACAFPDQFWFVSADSSDEDRRKKFMELAIFLFRSFGIFTAFQRYLSYTGDQLGVIGKVFFSLDAGLYEEVAQLEALVNQEVESREGTAREVPESAEREGLLLGYPSCCATWAAGLRINGSTFETEARKALIREEGISRFLGADSAPRPALAYFAFEFYPCHPRCAGAEGKGREMLTRYDQTDPMLAAVYRLHALPLNRGQVANQSVPYGERTRKFDSDLIGLFDGPHFNFPEPEAV